MAHTFNIGLERLTGQGRAISLPVAPARMGRRREERFVDVQIAAWMAPTLKALRCPLIVSPLPKGLARRVLRRQVRDAIATG
jgi:hypothetical protein